MLQNTGYFVILCRTIQRKPLPHDRNSVRFLDDQDESDSFSDTEASTQGSVLDAQSNTSIVYIANVPIQVIVDLGASCIVLNTAGS